MWVSYGRVPLRGPNLVAPSLEGLPARAPRQSAAALQVERVLGDPKAASSDFPAGDHYAHQDILLSGMGGTPDDRPAWAPNRHHQGFVVPP
jgi:hypothetical protein